MRQNGERKRLIYRNRVVKETEGRNQTPDLSIESKNPIQIPPLFSPSTSQRILKNLPSTGCSK